MGQICQACTCLDRPPAPSASGAEEIGSDASSESHAPVLVPVCVLTLAGRRLAEPFLMDRDDSVVRDVKEQLWTRCAMPVFAQQLVHPSLGLLEDDRALRSLPTGTLELHLVRLPLDDKAGASLLAPASRGEAAAVEDLLRGLADPNAERAADGATPLLVGAYDGRLEVVRLLCRAGADVDRPMRNGATALFVAAQNSHDEVVHYLCSRGADRNAAMQPDGWTPLLIAAQKGHLEVARCLCEQGAHVNRSMQDGATPLLVAARQGHLLLAQHLCKRGASVNRTKANGATPLHVAAEHGHLEVVQHLCASGAHVNKTMQDGATPLLIAAQKGHLPIVRHLCEWGADQHKATLQGTTPLLIAARCGRSDVTVFLGLYGGVGGAA